MKQTFKLMAAFSILAAFFTGCQKDDLSKLPEQDVITSGQAIKPAVVNGQTMVFKLPKRNNLKGLFLGELNIEQQIIRDYPYTTAANSYRVIKVVRPNGRYFWIMIDNFKYNAGAGCYIYGNNTANLATYGRLYNYTTANSVAAKNRIYMRLPRLVNGVLTTTLFNTYGRLPEFDDLKDLFEAATVNEGTHPLDPLYTAANPMFYYDAFIAGREDAMGDITKAYHTLSGMRDTQANNFQYYLLNERGTFWTRETTPTTPGFHFPLEVFGEVDDYQAIINAPSTDTYGFSVRYVFDPYKPL